MPPWVIQAGVEAAAMGRVPNRPAMQADVLELRPHTETMSRVCALWSFSAPSTGHESSQADEGCTELLLH